MDQNQKTPHAAASPPLVPVVPERTPLHPHWPHDRFLRTLLIVLAFDTIIAAFLTLVIEKPFVIVLVRSQAIGLSIFLLGWVLHKHPWGKGKHWQIAAVVVPLGGVVHIALGRILPTDGFGHDFFASPRALVVGFVETVVFGSIVAFYFYTRKQLAVGQARLQEEMLRRLENEQRLTTAELKLLQAQIEPHFLFNTLSNVLQLIDTNPGGAKSMLLNLTRYLRASLQRTRSGATTLGEELDLINAYCEIQAVRMGTRLAYRIDCPSTLRALPLPPLLLQPLVENAVRHGIEPQPEGGEIFVGVTCAGDVLHLEVTDTGLGIAAQSSAGVGLANVHDRVRAISNGRGTMITKPNTPHGLCIHIELPVAHDTPAVS